MPVAGPYYTKAEIEAVWIDEGGNPATADIASSIALAESSGGAGSWSANPGPCKTNWGAWQVCRPNAGDLLTLRGCARAAIAQSSDGKNWCDWQTFDGRGCGAGNYTGAYRQYMRGSPPPLDPGAIPGGISPVIPDARPFPPAAGVGERQWDYSQIVRAAARSHADTGRGVGAAALGVLAKLKRWRLPR